MGFFFLLGRIELDIEMVRSGKSALRLNWNFNLVHLKKIINIRSYTALQSGMVQIVCFHGCSWRFLLSIFKFSYYFLIIFWKNFNEIYSLYDNFSPPSTSMDILFNETTCLH